MIIKKGTKYYEGKEITKEEFEEYKNNLQKHYDTIDARIAKQKEKIDSETTKNKTNTKKELDILKTL